MDSRLVIRSLCLMVSALLAQPLPANAAKSLRGPVEVRVIRVMDGDTFRAEALVWPGHSVDINIRIRGIDAPEMKARCSSEREAAHRARDALADILRSRMIVVSNISGAKYYGRVLADVSTGDGVAVASTLLREKLVRPYDGGRRMSWCK